MQKVNRLKEILNERSLTNSWLARQLGVDPTTVSKWCTNSSQPGCSYFSENSESASSGCKRTI